MNIQDQLTKSIKEAVLTLYSDVNNVEALSLPLSPTRKDMEGDYTVVTFGLVKILKKSPEQIGQQLGEYIHKNSGLVDKFNTVKGFLNLSIADTYWTKYLVQHKNTLNSLKDNPNKIKVLVEFSSPNTNKPLHLGHLRNILLGWSVSQIYEALGHDVVKVQIINDKGIQISKSMLAYSLKGNNTTPKSTGVKGDHFVGDYYVQFQSLLNEEYKEWQHTEFGNDVFINHKTKDQSKEEFFKNYEKKYFNLHSKLGAQTKDLLIKWEANDPEVRQLWAKMNSWVYQGFDQTYTRLGVYFDKDYYESQTYLLGKKMVQQGLNRNLFQAKSDGSVIVDLKDKKLDEKVLLRSDGTSLYITQDLGTANLRYQDFAPDKVIYTVGDEQNNHFKVLFETLKVLEEPYANDLHHLSYGMVELPHGRMKSREGTVVDADDLIEIVVSEAKEQSVQRGEIADLSSNQIDQIAEDIGLAAIKYFIIKIKPEKWMTFNPQESVETRGQTGPYIQNAYVRIQSVLRKNNNSPNTKKSTDNVYNQPSEVERNLIKALYQYPETLQRAANLLDPSEIASYSYELAKVYHRFYQDHNILKAKSDAIKNFRLELSRQVANTLEHSMNILGINLPTHM